MFKKRILFLWSILVFPLLLDAGYVRVYYVLWGQGDYGDTIFIQLPGEDAVLSTPDDVNVLIDGGRENDFDYSRLDDFLDDLGVSTIHHMVVSSQGYDHYNGFDLVLASYTVLNYYENEPWAPGDKPSYDDLISALVSAGVSMHRDVDTGDMLSGPGADYGPGWDPGVAVEAVYAKDALPVTGDDDNEW